MAAPPTPTGLAAVAGNHNVVLSWNDAAGAVSYDVFRDDQLLTTLPAATFKALTTWDYTSSTDTANLTVTTSGTTYPAMNTLFDNFDTVTLAKWTTSGAPHIAGGALYVGASLAYDGALSVGTYDLTNTQLAVQVQQASVSVPAAQAFTGVQVNDPTTGFSYTIQTNSQTGNLEFPVVSAAGYSAGTPITYDPAVHCYWRIRHSTSSGNVTLETSANGSTYTNRRTVTAPLPVPVTGLQAYLYSGYNAGTTVPLPAIFDNVNSMSTALPAPTGVSGSAVNQNVTLSWVYPTGATAMEVWREGVFVTDVGAPTTSHILQEIRGFSYHYTLVARNTHTRSPRTPILTVNVT